MANENDQASQELVEQTIREFGLMAGSRGTFESHWEEIAERIMPSMRGSFFRSYFRTKGEKRNREVYDSTAALALGRFAAILDSLLTPRNQTWHKLKANNENVNRDRDVAMWFDDATRTLFKYRYAPLANFSSQNQKVYRSLGAFGSGCMYIDKLDGLRGEKGIRYKNVPLGSIYFAENHQGIVDKAYRFFRLTARQALKQFDPRLLPEVFEQTMQTNPEREFEFIQCVKPREDRDPKRKDYKGMFYASYYIALEQRKLVEEGGYNTFPFPASRYEQEDDEVYGRSPAMDALPAVKTLNEQKKTMLKQGHRALDPVLLAHDDGIVDSFSMKPGAVNAGGVSADGRPLVHALPSGNVQAGKELMDDERKVINDLFLVNLFQILTESPQMTATEVMERTREKGILLAPTIGRQQSEYLGPSIDRELDILSQQGLLPPMPGILKEARGEYSIVYDSPLSRAQRAEEASGIMRTMEQAMSYYNATQDNSVFDYIDIDEVMLALADINGVPAKWMRSVDQVQSIRQKREQDQKDQKMIQAAPAGAAMMKAMPQFQKAMGPQ